MFFLASVLLLMPAAVPGLQVPAGFEVTEFADSTLANDICCMTINPQGQVVVAGRGYLRLLVDDHGKGRADRAIDLAKEPKDGAMGLLWEEDTLFVSGDGGLRRFYIKDGKAVGPSELIRKYKTGGEHTGHALRRGPDGWLYLLAGNNTEIDATFAQTPASPIRTPIAGCVVRFTPDLKQSEIVADGYRNPYGMDFNLEGDLFTYDSDNERCVSLPWYEPTRLYHVLPGRNYGWRSPQHGVFWRRPPYFFDIVAPIATLGRGSPTGVACYNHTQFPEKYQGGLFLCDWTFGKIHYAPLQRDGSTYRSEPEVFLQTTGDHGFAPTAVAVHPQTGDLYVSIGGRGTRGAVYRIHYQARDKSLPAPKLLAMKQRKLLREEGLDDRLHPTPEVALRRGLDLLAGTSKLEGVRHLQLALGDIGNKQVHGTIWEGYVPGLDRKIPTETLIAAFPSRNADLNRELTRTMGMLAVEDEKLRARILERFDAKSDPVEDIHYLAVLARLPGLRSEQETAMVASSLLDLDRKLNERKLKRDTHWPSRVQELVAGLIAKDQRLARRLGEHAEFGRPDHAIFTRVEGFPRQEAARIFLGKIKDDRYPLSSAILRVLEVLPSEMVVPTLRARYGETGLETEMLPFFAKQPQPNDRGKLVEGLQSMQSATMRACLLGLERLQLPADTKETFALVQALRRLPEKQDDLRQKLILRLESITAQKHGPNVAAWTDWLLKTHPDLSARLNNPDGVDLAAWEKRLPRLDWDRGDAKRGEIVYRKASCINCHSGSQALGPDLTGVAQRFSRADLMTAIVQPSKDVAERYRTTILETADGKVQQGLIIYDAVDSLILQTGNATLRFDGQAIVSRRTSPQSLMPAGLLDPLPDTEIVDLLAYLRQSAK